MLLARIGLVIFLLEIAQVAHSAPITQLDQDTLNKLTPLQQLGQQIFFDPKLSSPPGQACASCHDPKTAYSEPLVATPVSLGAVPGRRGTRNTPSMLYAVFSPRFHFDPQDKLYLGGQFLDGRASDLIEQAKGPFLNPDEMNNKDEAEVVAKLRMASYAPLFTQVYGKDALQDVKQAYQYLAEAIVQFELAPVFARFTSKYDYYLKDEASLTAQEKWGLQLFNDERKGNCAACHPSESDDDSPPLFTDYSYDNLGVPSNPLIKKQKDVNFVDLGLGKILNQPSELGKFKVPSLRNVAKTAPYMHNGVFTTLRDAVAFYSTRDTDPRWGKPEVAANVNTTELGNLKLSSEEIDALVAFLQTLTDGYEPDGAINRLNNSGLVILPKVKIYRSQAQSTWIEARLKQDINNPNLFNLLYAAPLKGESVWDSQLLPTYSLDNRYLEISRIKVDGYSDYIAQLQQVPNNKIPTFRVIYAKPLQ